MKEHQSRFKAYLIQRENSAAEARALAPALTGLEALQHQMSPAHFVLLFIALFAQTRRPGQWYMGRGRGAAEPHDVDFSFAKLPEDFKFLQTVASSANELMNRREFKKLPGAVLNALRSWHAGRYKLVLFPKPVSPFEMLSMQARGERAVTLDMAAAKSGATVDGQRDALEFLLHDLVHADLYYTNGHLAQRRFFASFLKITELGLLKDDWQNNSELKHDLDYLVADMNSDVHHLTAHLIAALVKNQLVKESKGPRDILSEGGRQAVTDLLATLQKQGDFTVPLRPPQPQSTATLV